MYTYLLEISYREKSRLNRSTVNVSFDAEEKLRNALENGEHKTIKTGYPISDTFANLS